MALITRCPSCLTSFQVTGSQLEQASGWVRCGRCDHIFHGGSQLHPTATKPLATEPLAAEPLAIEPTSTDPVEPTLRPGSATHNLTAEPEMAPASGSTPARSDASLEPNFTAAAPAAPNVPSAHTNADLEPGLDAPPALAEEPVFGPVDREPVLNATPTSPEPPLSVEPPPVVVANDHITTPLAQDATHLFDAPLTADPSPGFFDAPHRPTTPSFVARARRRALWQHRAIRGVLGLAAALLVVTLVVQSVILQRDRIAAHYPQSLPVLNALCEIVNCTIAPYRNLQALQIDSSSLKETEGDALALEVTLHNRQAVAVAMPALELTLSDLNGQILTRRALLPADLAAPQKLAGGSRWYSQMTLVPTQAAPAHAVVNYKLKMFYP